MRKLILMLCLVVLPLGSVVAGELKTVSLAVDGMTCSMCPLTVKRALRKVQGVSEVTARYEGDGVGWTRVTYDPAKVSVKDLTHATAQAGYPSQLQP